MHGEGSSLLLFLYQCMDERMTRYWPANTHIHTHTHTHSHTHTHKVLASQPANKHTHTNTILVAKGGSLFSID